MDVTQICLTRFVPLALSVGRLLTLLFEQNLPKVQNKMELVLIKDKNAKLNQAFGRALERMSLYKHLRSSSLCACCSQNHYFLRLIPFVFIDQLIWMYILPSWEWKDVFVSFAVPICPWCDLASGTVTSVLQPNKMLWSAIPNNWIHGITWLWRTSGSRLEYMFFQCDAEPTKAQNGRRSSPQPGADDDYIQI